MNSDLALFFPLLDQYSSKDEPVYAPKQHCPTASMFQLWKIFFKICTATLADNANWSSSIGRFKKNKFMRFSNIEKKQTVYLSLASSISGRSAGLEWRRQRKPAKYAWILRGIPDASVPLIPRASPPKRCHWETTTHSKIGVYVGWEQNWLFLHLVKIRQNLDVPIRPSNKNSELIQ